jgi:hypothetical protein
MCGPANIVGAKNVSASQGPCLEQGYRYAELEPGGSAVHGPGNGQNLIILRKIEHFLAVLSSDGLEAAVGGDANPIGAGVSIGSEGASIDLRVSRFVRGVGEPSAIGREPAKTSSTGAGRILIAT